MFGNTRQKFGTIQGYTLAEDSFRTEEFSASLISSSVCSFEQTYV